MQLLSINFLPYDNMTFYFVFNRTGTLCRAIFMKLYGLKHPINYLHNYLLIIFWLSETRQLVSDSVYCTALLKYQAFFIIPG